VKYAEPRRIILKGLTQCAAKPKGRLHFGPMREWTVRLETAKRLTP